MGRQMQIWRETVLDGGMGLVANGELDSNRGMERRWLDGGGTVNGTSRRAWRGRGRDRGRGVVAKQTEAEVIWIR